jgi:hypothetical protein
MGGTDDTSNLIELTIEEHAEAHRILYEQHGHWQDKVAWHGLLGLIGHEDIMRKMYDARKGKGNHMYGKPCYYKMTEEEKQRWKDNISKGTKGRKVSDETRKKMSENSGKSQLGKTPWNKGKTGVQTKSLETKMKISKPVMYKGIEYYSIEEAARINNTTAYYIVKEVKGINTPTRKCTTRNRHATSK